MKRLALVLALLPGAAMAQKLDCGNPVTQQDMNQCAYQDFQGADAALNDIYALAIFATQEMDQYGEGTAEETLRAAQRAWITFRDLACEVEGLQAEGGSMQPMLVSACLARLTWSRVDDLGYLTDY